MEGSKPAASQAAIAQLGERQTEDLKVPGSIPGLGITFIQPRRIVILFHLLASAAFMVEAVGCQGKRIGNKYQPWKARLFLLMTIIWTHWDLNPGPSACEADVIPLHHVPHA